MLQRNTSAMSVFENNQNKPYCLTDNQNVHAVEYTEDQEEYPKIFKYYFSFDNGGLLLAMRYLCDKARWPRKTDKATGYKDKSKLLAFHEYFCRITDECD